MTTQTGDDLAQQALADATQNQHVTPAALNAADPDDLAQTLTSLQNIIERNANELDRIKEQLKAQREGLQSVFENDEELSDVQDQATAITQKVKERKSKLQASQQVNQLKAKVAELLEQKKEIEEALNNHLLNLYQITGTKTFDTSTGEQREFEVRASIKGKKLLKNE